MNRPFGFTALLALCAGVLLAPVPAAAQASSENWVEFSSPGGLYKARIPRNYQLKTHSLLTGDNRAVNSEEISVLIDQRPYKDIQKSYMIQLEQTLGPGLSQAQFIEMIEKELNYYETYYRNMQGETKQRTLDTFDNGSVEAELYMSYTDPQAGAQSVRIKIYGHGASKMRQIAAGPDEMMNAFRTQQYFDNLHYEGANALSEETMQSAWPEIRSKLGVFKTHAPPAAEPFVPADASHEASPNFEVVRMTFYDPLRKERLFYNVYGYTFGQALNFSHAEKVLLLNHAAKQRPDPGAVAVKKFLDRELPTLSAIYKIPPPQGLPYAGSVRLQAEFIGNRLLVRELVGSTTLTQSSFGQSLFDMTKLLGTDGMPLPAQGAAPVQSGGSVKN